MASFPNPFQAPKEHFIIRFYDPNTGAKDAGGRTLEDILQWNDAQLEQSHDYIQVLFPLPEGSMFSYNAPLITREVVEAFHVRSELRHRLALAFNRMLKFYGFTVSAEPEEEEQEQEEEQKKEAERQVEAGTEAEGENTAEGKGNEKQEEDQVINGVDEPDCKESAADTTIQQPAEDVVDAAATADPTNTPIVGVQGVDVSNLGLPGTEMQPGRSLMDQAARVDRTPKPLMGYYVIRGEDWRQAFRNWAVRMDHNHLRISRILRCLRVLGMHKECEGFYIALKRVFNSPNIYINERSMMFWRRAVRQPLHIAPDGERVPWLKALAEEQEQHP